MYTVLDLLWSRTWIKPLYPGLDPRLVKNDVLDGRSFHLVRCLLKSVRIRTRTEDWRKVTDSLERDISVSILVIPHLSRSATTDLDRAS